MKDQKNINSKNRNRRNARGIHLNHYWQGDSQTTGHPGSRYSKREQAHQYPNKPQFYSNREEVYFQNNEIPGYYPPFKFNKSYSTESHGYKNLEDDVYHPEDPRTMTCQPFFGNPCFDPKTTPQQQQQYLNNQVQHHSHTRQYPPMGQNRSENSPNRNNKKSSKSKKEAKKRLLRRDRQKKLKSSLRLARKNIPGFEEEYPKGYNFTNPEEFRDACRLGKINWLDCTRDKRGRLLHVFGARITEKVKQSHLNDPANLVLNRITKRTNSNDGYR